ARMNNNFSDFHVDLLGSDGTRAPVTGAWGSSYLTNDTWSGTVSVPENFPDGQTKIAVRAMRISASGSDFFNQELDLDGSGSSVLGAEDRSVDFLPYALAVLVGHGFDFIPQSIIANTPKFTPGDIALGQIKRYTAPYARRVALCPPLTRPAGRSLCFSPLLWSLLPCAPLTPDAPV
ncbi:MAG: hypothetical protein AB1734_01410, partial [Elusimicrobiota bacterium]